MEGDNLYVSPKGLRFCKACRRTTLARFEERKRVDREAKRHPGKPTPPKATPPAERTHCPQGHPYDGENLRINAAGRRVCAECQREANRRAREKRRAEAGPREPQRSANAEKTHCPRGHPYDGENLVIDNGARKCRTCRRESSRRAYLKRKQRN
jgi:hypothetical protein